MIYRQEKCVSIQQNLIFSDQAESGTQAATEAQTSVSAKNQNKNFQIINLRFFALINIRASVSAWAQSKECK